MRVEKKQKEDEAEKIPGAAFRVRGFVFLEDEEGPRSRGLVHAALQGAEQLEFLAEKRKGGKHC